MYQGFFQNKFSGNYSENCDENCSETLTTILTALLTMILTNQIPKHMLYLAFPRLPQLNGFIFLTEQVHCDVNVIEFIFLLLKYSDKAASYPAFQHVYGLTLGTHPVLGGLEFSKVTRPSNTAAIS
ncbi:hypothetical protein [Paenibacillus humicola]|uniref:hypothetical protein n=1 Tax=Paenibacillus humicola TaxID=3110540 RepID=UPI00237AD86C|nr:hypothetical protein [Paenibacillus humicola]